MKPPFFTEADCRYYPGQASQGRHWLTVTDANTKVAPLLSSISDLQKENATLKYEAEARIVLYDEQLSTMRQRVRELEGLNQFLRESISNNEAFAAKHMDRQLENQRLRSLLQMARGALAEADQAFTQNWAIDWNLFRPIIKSIDSALKGDE